MPAAASPELPCLRGSSCSFQAASACFSSRLHARLMSEPSALYSRQFVHTCVHSAGFICIHCTCNATPVTPTYQGDLQKWEMKVYCLTST